MGTSALHSAATGLQALSMQVDVIANNLANVNTVGFRKSRVNFEDLLYEELSAPGTRNNEGVIKPTGLFVGMGVRVANTETLFSPGSIDTTNRELDVAIDGQGFFQVKIPETYGTNTGYTRAGNLSLTADGTLVVGNSDGFLLEPPIQLPPEAVNVTITEDGRVYYTTNDSVSPIEVGQLQLARFVNPGGMRPIGSTIYVETDASGAPIVGNPTEDGLGRILQRALESSNVDPTHELVDLIKAQRAFELNSQTIQSADEMLQVVANLRKF